MSDTPETDHAAFVLKDWRESYDVVLVSFAEQLERERDIYEDALQRIYDTSSGWFEDVWANIEEVSTIAHNALNKTL
jgi:hypothetical protein